MMIRSTSYLLAHLEAESAAGSWSVRKQELEMEMEFMIDGFVGFMQGAHVVSISSRSPAFKRYAARQFMDQTLA
jgi:hypothetical protein